MAGDWPKITAVVDGSRFGGASADHRRRTGEGPRPGLTVEACTLRVPCEARPAAHQEEHTGNYRHTVGK